jgi:uncharacterized protein YidB (DUF937 family)
MGLLDSVIGALSGGQGGAAGGGVQGQLLNAVVGMLTHSGGAAGAGAAGAAGGLGGLGGLLTKFQQAGLGDAAASWVGKGENHPVSADQVSGALGPDMIGQLAKQLGLTHGETSGHLSELLPQLVDKLTPHGSVPEGGITKDSISGMGGLGDLLGKFMK